VPSELQQGARDARRDARVCLLKVQRNGQRRACQDGGGAHGRCRLVYQRARRLRAGSHVRRPVRVSASASSFTTRSCSAVFWACALRVVPHCGDEVVGRAAHRGELCEKGPESDSLRQGGAQLCPTRQTRGRHPVCRRARDAVGVSRARSVAAQRQLTAWKSAAKQHRPAGGSCLHQATSTRAAPRRDDSGLSPRFSRAVVFVDFVTVRAIPKLEMDTNIPPY